MERPEIFDQFGCSIQLVLGNFFLFAYLLVLLVLILKHFQHLLDGFFLLPPVEDLELPSHLRQLLVSPHRSFLTDFDLTPSFLNISHKRRHIHNLIKMPPAVLLIPKTDLTDK